VIDVDGELFTDDNRGDNTVVNWAASSRAADLAAVADRSNGRQSSGIPTVEDSNCR